MAAKYDLVSEASGKVRHVFSDGAVREFSGRIDARGMLRSGAGRVLADLRIRNGGDYDPGLVRILPEAEGNLLVSVAVVDPDTKEAFRVTLRGRGFGTTEDLLRWKVDRLGRGQPDWIAVRGDGVCGGEVTLTGPKDRAVITRGHNAGGDIVVNKLY